MKLNFKCEPSSSANTLQLQINASIALSASAFVAAITRLFSVLVGVVVVVATMAGSDEREVALAEPRLAVVVLLLLVPIAPPPPPLLLLLLLLLPLLLPPLWPSTPCRCRSNSGLPMVSCLKTCCDSNLLPFITTASLSSALINAPHATACASQHVAWFLLH